MDHSVSKAHSASNTRELTLQLVRYTQSEDALSLLGLKEKVARIYRRRHSLDNDKLCTVKSHALELLVLLEKQWDLAENRP